VGAWDALLLEVIGDKPQVDDLLSGPFLKIFAIFLD
jgi:hypothetical protein